MVLASSWLLGCVCVCVLGVLCVSLQLELT